MDNLPFYSFSFTLVENARPRASLRLDAKDDGLYELAVQKGSAANPLAQFTRMVPCDTARRLRDALQEIGVFNWDEEYGDASAPGTRRWSVTTVFQEGVFSVASKGGSDVPHGFDAVLEELYRLDFPRPASVAGNAGTGALRTPIAQGPAGIDFARFADELRRSGMPGLDVSNLNAHEIEVRMKSEFRRLSPSEQNQLLDALASTGLASRAWWERFFRS